MKDEMGRYVFLSENYQRRFGIRFEEWQGKTDGELRPPEVAEQFRRNDQNVLESGESIEVMEPTIESDGTTAWWLSNKFLLLDEEGRRYVGGLAVDVTAQHQARQALEELNETVETRIAERAAVAERRAKDLRRLAARLNQAEHTERQRLAKLLHDDLQQLLVAAKFNLPFVFDAVREFLLNAVKHSAPSRAGFC